MESKYKLSFEQKRVILSTEKLRKVIACAGSGKTSVLTASIIEVLKKKKCLPSEILALTFTKNAATNMRVRISKELPSLTDTDMIDIYTFNSFGNQIIKENSYLFGLSKDFYLLNEARSWQIVFEIFKDSEFEYLKAGKNIAQFTNRILDYIWNIKNNLINIDQINYYLNNFESVLQYYKSKGLKNDEYGKINYLKEISKIYIEYERIKTSQNCIDYADQIFLPYQLFNESIVARKKYSKKYKYIFVDEFQDTNNSQAFLLSKIFNPKYNNIMIVGDDDQGIYGFRGACIENIIDMQYFDSDMVLNLKPYFLTVNFRSGEKIIDFTNNIISKNKNRHPKTTKPEYEGKKSEVFFFKTLDVKEESAYISRMITQLKENGIMLKDIAILCRKKQFNEIMKALRQADIKYEFVGNKNLFYENEILFLVSWLKLINNIYDEESLVYLLKSSRYKICDRDIYFLRYYMKNNLIDSIKIAEKNTYITRKCKKKLVSFMEELEYYIQKSEQYNLSGIINLIFHHSGLYEEINSRFGHNIKKKIKNVETLIKIASGFEHDNSNADFESFIIYLKELAKTEVENPDNIEISNDNSVKIMSIHAAKGLEFEVVFLPMLWDKDYKPRLSSKTEFELPAYLMNDSKIWSEKPLYSSMSKFKDVLKDKLREEERRIFYVGASRAKKLLVLSYPLYKDFKGNNEDKPDDILEFVEEGIVVDKQRMESKGVFISENGMSMLYDGKESYNDCISKDFGKILKNIGFCDYGYGRNEKKYKRRETNKKVQMINLSNKNYVSAIEYHLAEQISCFSKNPNYDTFIKEKVICHNKNKKEFLTLTEILTYMDCPKLYEYRYLMKIPEGTGTVDTAFGTKLHRLIAKITGQLYEGYKISSGNGAKVNMDFKSLLNEYLEEVSSINESKLRICLTNFIESSLVDFTNIDDIFLEKLINWKLSDFFVRCQIDRIDLIENNFLRIYDYKSGAKRNNDIDSYYKNQVSFYIIAASDYFKIPVERIQGFIFYLENNEMDKIIIDDDQKKVINKTLSNTSKKMSQVNHPLKHTEKCDKCTFTLLCR